MIQNLLGLTGVLFVCVCILAYTYTWPAVSKLLWTALLIRVGAALFHFYVGPLPDSSADAVAFELQAWQWSQNGLFKALDEYTGPDSFFISWIIALLYSITDRSQLLAQSISIFMGTSSILIGWLLIRDLWNQKIATKAAWILVFFPTHILYSVIVMRESYVWFFLTLALLGIVRWSQSGKLKFILLINIGFIGAMFFHGAMIIGLFAFYIFFFLKTIKQNIINIYNLKLSYSLIFFGILFIVLVYALNSGIIIIPKLGNISLISVVDLLNRAEFSMSRESGADYPAWTTPNTTAELLYKTPIRTIYFIFSPFPWDIKKPSHLIGLFDGMIYMGFAVLIWRNRKNIKKNQAAIALLFIFIAYLIVFGFAIGNFGTGIRHRAKFLIIIIALSAPLIFKRKLSATLKK